MSQISNSRYGVYMVGVYVDDLTPNTYVVEISYRSHDQLVVAWSRSFQTRDVNYHQAISRCIAEYITAVKTGVVPNYGVIPVDFTQVRELIEGMVDDSDFVLTFNSSAEITAAVSHHGREYVTKGEVMVNSHPVQYVISTTLIGPSKCCSAIYRVTFTYDYMDDTERDNYRVADGARNCIMTVTNRNNVLDINEFVKLYEDKLIDALGL